MLDEFLRRFREAGVPGAPAAAGAPADPAATLDAELLPVFALLEDVERAVDAIEIEGRRQAEQRRTKALDDAAAVVAEAHLRASGEQAAAAATRLASSAERCAVLRRQAAREAARIDASLAERIPPLVAELVERVLDCGRSAATE
jgi:flagellar biosynthesis/type III secretory pathway protein FliH